MCSLVWLEVMAEIFSGDLTCGTSMGGLRCHAVQARAWRGQLEAVGCPALLKFLKSESTGFLNSMYGSFQDTIPCEIEPSSRHHVQCELLLESSASHQCVYGVGFLLLLFRFHGTLVMICRTLFFWQWTAGFGVQLRCLRCYRVFVLCMLRVQ